MEIFFKLFYYLEYIFWFVLVFSIIVFIHELGHFYVAKANKVKVDRFSIGFGKPLLKFKDSNNTVWQLCLIPLGGYVKFSGEMYPEKSERKEKKINSELFMNKTSLQKASIVLAGPLANFILGIFLFVLIFVLYGKNYTSPVIGYIEKGSPSEVAGLQKYDKILEMNNNKIKSFEDVSNFLDDNIYEIISFKVDRNGNFFIVDVRPEIRVIETFIGSKREINFLGLQPILDPVIGKVLVETPAYYAGLKSKDKIIQINDKKVENIRDVISLIKENANNQLNFLILRDGEKINYDITPALSYKKDGTEKGVIGVQFSQERKRLNLFAALAESLENFRIIIVKTILAFSEIIFGKRDHCEVGGPILIAKVSNDIGSQDLVSFLSLIALISINLGLINLFPLPLLDGGHFFTYMYEVINKKKVTKNFYKYFQTIGAFLIISLMFFSVFNDIYCRVLN